MLKRYLPALVLAGLLSTVTPALIAQDAGANDQPSAPAGAPEAGHGRRHFDPNKRSEMMAKHLKLSADQQAKVKDILTSEQSDMQKLHEDSSMSQQDRRAKMMDLHKTSDDQIRALLNADQQKKFDEMQSRREQWMQNHRRGGEGPGAAPSPDSEQK